MPECDRYKHDEPPEHVAGGTAAHPLRALSQAVTYRDFGDRRSSGNTPNSGMPWVLLLLRVSLSP